MSYLHKLGAAAVLSEHGFVKEAAELSVAAMISKYAEETPGAAGEGNPFENMSDEQLLQLIQALPPEAKQEILKQLQALQQGA